VAAETLPDPRLLEPLVANDPLLPRHLRTDDLPAGGDAVSTRFVLVGNDDLTVAAVAAVEPSGLYRNAIGDELVYVRSGRARLESVYGVLDVGPGDYVVVSMSTTHRWIPVGDEPLRLLVVEASGHITFPSRYLSSCGQLLEHAPFCERDLRAPEVLLAEESDGEPTPVVVRHRGGLTRYQYRFHPFDVVGWAGCLYPFALSIHDFEPITGRIHQPPPVHQTFAGPRFVVCSFVPRLFDYHPLAIPAPYNHANVDSDELLFYVDGDFMSRKGSGVGAGSISLHPAGFVHGPQPGSVEASIGKTTTEELAVMIDTFAPVRLGPAAFACEDPEYAWSWQRGLEAGRSTT
ncbi:MAG TPA: cupin domain-containing protein, partial [Acidimicrobiales bacterium]|nr:cupin domain-containing protein [Acidimicrobiales bacterium]